MNQSKISAIIAAAVLPAVALAHGPVITLTDTDGVIVTHQLDLGPVSNTSSTADYPVGQAARSYQVIPLVQQTSPAYAADDGWYGQLETVDTEGNGTPFLGPGLAFGEGGFPNLNTTFKVTFADTAKVWNAAAGTFTATGGEQIQGLRSSSFSATGFVNTLTSNGVQGGTGLITGTVGKATVANGVTTYATSPGNHSQFMWRLLGADGTPTSPIADGLYLASLQISATDGSVAASLPYYLLFEKNAGGTITPADVGNAQAYVNATLAPEPASLALAGLGVGGLLSRRRRRGR